MSGDPDDVIVTITDQAGTVSLWLGLDSTDLDHDAADQLSAYLRVAAARAR